MHGWKVASPGMDQALEGGKMRLQEGSAFCLGLQSKKDRSGTLGKGPGAPPDETSCFIPSVCPTIPASAQPRVLTPFAPLGCGASPASPRSAWKPSGGLEEQGVIFSAPSFPPLLGFFISHGSGERAAGLEQEAARGGQGLVPSSGGCGLSVPPLSASSILLAAASSKGRPGLCRVLDTSPSLGWCRGDRGCHHLRWRWHCHLIQDPNKATKRGFWTQMR